ncbi:lipase family alpha/beta hydrolase [Haliangium ochraceum]|uniref:Lipase class 2 n=1 Tax=Haliangium ochraceum (strain DSM 14365 / JCM 11303 / SMP-2) TaxID=502025 RepID=D0LL03_HALO1|nr:alpha/beta fold hydrolase [Haliangium ochraceum]ACY16723.1 lipase class 2 [Haliangium ochraceum DSM 14365]
MKQSSSIPWLLRWISAAPSRWLGRSSAVQQYIAGGTHGLSYLRHLARGNRVRRQASFEAIPEGQRPLLVIHGFMGTRGTMYPLEQRLAEDGFCVFSFNLGAINIRDIRRSAFLIHRKVERILEQTGWRELDIVAHSMGGLIGLYYIKKLGGHERVRKLVTLGTPYRGTWIALCGVATLGLLSTSSWQLVPGSRFLGELHDGPIPAGVHVYSIAAARDWLCPPSATRLQGVQSLTVPFGHGSLVVSADVYQYVQRILQSEAAVPEDIPFEAGADQQPWPERLEYDSVPSSDASPDLPPATQPLKRARAKRVRAANRGDAALAETSPRGVTSSALSSRRGKGNG